MASDLLPSDGAGAAADGPKLASRLLSTGFGLLVAWLGVMWAVEIIDTVALSDRLQSNGIHPRRVDGIDGILWAPSLHSTFGHLISNSIPFVALGFLVALRGLRYWLTVTAAVIVVGGGLTWLLAGSGNHIGASGVVFGYFGALIGAAVFERRPRSIAPALVALLLYSGIVVGLVPQEGISWEGHLFGLVAGAVVARSAAKARRREAEAVQAKAEEPQYPWELDQPWLDNS